MSEPTAYPERFPQVTELPEGYTVVRHHRPASPSGILRESLTWQVQRDGQPVDSYVYNSEETARRLTRRSLEVEAARALVQQAAPLHEVRGYTRDEYEHACAAVGIVPAPDNELGTYADRYGDFWMEQYSAVHIITAELRRRRMYGLPAPEPTPARPGPKPLGHCGNCGNCGAPLLPRHRHERQCGNGVRRRMLRSAFALNRPGKGDKEC